LVGRTCGESDDAPIFWIRRVREDQFKKKESEIRKGRVGVRRSNRGPGDRVLSTSRNESERLRGRLPQKNVKQNLGRERVPVNEVGEPGRDRGVYDDRQVDRFVPRKGISYS